MFICICDASRELIVIDSLPLSRQNTDEDEDAREVSGKDLVGCASMSVVADRDRTPIPGGLSHTVIVSPA